MKKHVIPLEKPNERGHARALIVDDTGVQPVTIAEAQEGQPNAMDIEPCEGNQGVFHVRDNTATGRCPIVLVGYTREYGEGYDDIAWTKKPEAEA